MRIFLLILLLISNKIFFGQNRTEKREILNSIEFLQKNNYANGLKTIKKIHSTPRSRKRKYYTLYNYALCKSTLYCDSLTIKDSVRIRYFRKKLIASSEILNGFWRYRKRRFNNAYSLNVDSIQNLIKILNKLLDSDSTDYYKNLVTKKINYENLVDSTIDEWINNNSFSTSSKRTAHYNMRIKRAGKNGEDLIINFTTFYDSTFDNYKSGTYKNITIENSLLILGGVLKNEAQLQIKIKGTIIGVTDSVTPTENLKYGNEWGLISYNSSLTSMTIKPYQSLNNHQLGFLRAYFARLTLDEAFNDYKPESIVIELGNKHIEYAQGGKYRRIDIRLHLYNWYIEKYNSLPKEIKNNIEPNTNEIVIEDGVRIR